MCWFWGFQRHIQNFTTYSVDVMKKGKFFQVGELWFSVKARVTVILVEMSIWKQLSANCPVLAISALIVLLCHFSKCLDQSRAFA
ncbi:ligatin [Iris pallida]|uniref:Ligatin n=1 Tax=Iris pallida TaxID=29817 RepID=A0AAX6EV05_IRIPA|nr:ligatin [Iris pallida]